MADNSASNLPMKTAYFNREVSWLAFNRRVLEQAYDDRFPLLERMRFLSFVSSNLDEFFEIRVAGLIQQVESNVVSKGIDGLGPKEQLRRVHSISSSLVTDQYKCWKNILIPEFRKKEIFFKEPEELNEREMKWLSDYFENDVYPVLTPLAIDPSHPFPKFANKSLNIVLNLQDPSRDEFDHMLAFIPVPRILPRVVKIPGTDKEPDAYVFLSGIVATFATQLFPGYTIKSAHAFRITRNSDLYIDEEEVENLLLTIEDELYKMRRGNPVRLEIEEGVPDDVLENLLKNIGLARQHVFKINGPINLMRLMSVYDLIDRDDLKFKPYIPRIPEPFSGDYNIYETIREENYLLHHPYDSFSPIVDFVKQASTDPQVLAIKMTLYRTSSDSPIIKALVDAAHNDKQVTALIELKARFDEANNINWARQLEEAGVHVVYGLVGLKTHSKCCLVVRREGNHLRRYAHLGTGNYHTKTAKLYTDLSMFTADEELTHEVAEVFNTLTGFAKNPQFKNLLVAPYTLHSTMQKLIAREAENAKAGKPARIIAKCNSLIDKETIDSLYAASQAGVKIDLIIRGICGLVPGVKGMSENIRVRSILGRYLEHSRIYYFENGENTPDIYIGSADWMQRNFFRRIEVVFPVKQKNLRERIIHEILENTLKDNTAKQLRSNGAYVKIPQGKNGLFCSQNFFMDPEAFPAPVAKKKTAKKKTTSKRASTVKRTTKKTTTRKRTVVKKVAPQTNQSTEENPL
jgi:polyphosphate kinase